MERRAAGRHAVGGSPTALLPSRGSASREDRSAGSGVIRCALMISVMSMVATLAGCGDGAQEPPAISVTEQLLQEMTDPQVDPETRIARIAAQAREGNQRAVPALLRVMKDRSQQAFLLANDAAHPLGYRAVEFKDTGPDTRAMERVAAIGALDVIGSHLALPDLALALDDRSAVVANHAARALLRLGNRSGLPVLLDNLEKRAFENETASRILREITGQNFGFGPDVGHAAKQEAIARWRSWYAALPPAAEQTLPLEGQPYRQGMDGETDRRIQFYVDMLGQMQFLYHEQVRTALQRIGAPAIPHLRSGVEGREHPSNETTRAGVAQVLARIDHPNSRDLLRELLGDAYPTVRSRAALSLAELGGADALAALRGVLDDPDPSVRVAALRGLGRIGGAEALAILESFDPGDDAALRTTRTFARFRASEGREGGDEVLELLVTGELPDQGGAHEVLIEVTGDATSYDPLASIEERRKVAEHYRAVLKR